jgi:hypothetical protein
MARQPLYPIPIGFAARPLAFREAVSRIPGPRGPLYGLGEPGAARRRAIGRCRGHSLPALAGLIAAYAKRRPSSLASSKNGNARGH